MGPAVRWRRVAVVAAVLAVLGGFGAVGSAAPASANGIGDCSITRGTPGPPTNLRAEQIGPLVTLVRWSQPLNNLLGLDCRPILEYALWMQDLTAGTGWSLIYQGQPPQTLAGPLSNHVVQFAAHGRNVSGWSTSYAFVTFAVP